MNTRQFVNSSDSIAIMAAHAEHIPGYAGGLNGVARTMPASRALDRVAESLQIPCFETPAGWKFFGSLLDSGDVTLCGDESFGASSSHLREKDGLWAILFWLNILALRRQSLSDIVQTHWQRFGRDLYTRHDYENLEIDQAESLMEDLRRRLHDLPGRQMAGYQIGWSDEFCYIDPLDGSHSKAQGIRIGFANGARIVYRLSGTGTQGATLRLYLERHEPDRARQLNDPQQALAELIHIANDLLPVQQKTLRKQPDKII
jgi:phosphoglucomutase